VCRALDIFPLPILGALKPARPGPDFARVTGPMSKMQTLVFSSLAFLALHLVFIAMVVAFSHISSD
jgi:hypothetical protein